MREDQRGDVGQKLAGTETSGWRHALYVVPFLLAGLLASIALTEWTSMGGLGLLLLVLLFIAVGIYARTWLVLLTSYVGTVMLFWVIEVVSYAWMGGQEWARRNAEHWQGNEPAIQKLTGQLIEYAVLPLIFMLPLVAAGVAIGRWIERDSGRHHHLEHGV